MLNVQKAKYDALSISFMVCFNCIPSIVGLSHLLKRIFYVAMYGVSAIGVLSLQKMLPIACTVSVLSEPIARIIKQNVTFILKTVVPPRGWDTHKASTNNSVLTVIGSQHWVHWCIIYSPSVCHMSSPWAWYLSIKRIIWNHINGIYSSLILH